MTELSSRHEDIARHIVDSAFAVHSTLGPGLLESVYEQCLAFELTARNIAIRRQVGAPIIYRSNRIEAGFRMDLVVDDLIVVEIKACEQTLPIHEAQLLTYLRLSDYQLGFLINFNVTLIKNGIRRIICSR